MTNAKRFYVYELVDPRTGAVFYVGKGVGARMYHHARDVRRGHRSNEAKTRIIEAIHSAGSEPIARAVAHYEDERDAIEHEADMICSMSGLTNIMARGVARFSPEEAQRRLLMRQEKISVRKMASNRAWLAQWLKRAEAWPDVVFPNLQGGVGKAREFMADLRKLLGEGELKVARLDRVRP